MLPRVLVADVDDPAGDRVRIIRQFFWLEVGGEPLQVALGQRGDDGEESLVRAPQVGQHLGEGLLSGRLADQLVEWVVLGRAIGGKIDAERRSTATAARVSRADTAPTLRCGRGGP